jgi:hypothetical protein
MSIGKPDNIISPLENVGSVPIFTRYLPDIYPRRQKTQERVFEEDWV